MLPKKKRLSREEFNRFFSLGKRTHTVHTTIVYVPHPTLHASVVVSKKVSTRAVVRNKVRRRIYDIVKNYERKEGVVGVFIFLTKKGVERLPYHALKEEVDGRLRTITH